MEKIEFKEYGTEDPKDQQKLFDRLRKRWPNHTDEILPYMDSKPEDLYHIGDCTVRVCGSTNDNKSTEMTGRLRARIETKGIIEKITGIKLIERN